MDKVTGNTLIEWGYTPGKWFNPALQYINSRSDLVGLSHADVRDLLVDFIPSPEPDKIPMQNPEEVPIHFNIEASTEGSPEDFENLLKVQDHMNVIAKIPTVRAISVMPDACPAGSALGTIPVGGVVVTENAIHPGMHSADACCSMAISILDHGDPKSILDSAMRTTHFGAGGRDPHPDINMPSTLQTDFFQNQYLYKLVEDAKKHFGTQGDGNHFFSVGTLESTGQTCIITHQGSRKPGAELYKKGLADAWEYTKTVCPEVGKHNAWLPYDSEKGQEYWKALQLIRLWARENHYAIHGAVVRDLGLRVKDQFWNEHNFIFKRDNYFYHAKGATPNYGGFSTDWSYRTIIPMNMASPILICRVGDVDLGKDFNTPSLGFCPHGAGRTLSRTEFTKRLEAKGLTPKGMIADVTSKFDIRAFSGSYDITEFPEAYKEPKVITDAIEKFKLTEIIDRVLPYGSIMMGHSNWSKRRGRDK